MNKIIPLTLGIAGIILSSCFKDEAPNAEADIVKCTLPVEILTDREIDYYKAIDNESGKFPLDIEVVHGTDLSELAPAFELTPGASISPASGSKQDFNSPVEYTVTSESGEWKKTYMVNIHHPEEIPTYYGFENATQQGTYYTLYETDTNGNRFEWASGNSGFAIAAQLQGINSPNEYPTSISTNGKSGKCLKLETKLTGEWGAKVGKPIAAGNLFMGVFHLPVAVTNSLNATRFGVTFRHKPIRLTGYYKYKAGDKYYDEGKYTSQKDQCSIYAMLFEKDEQTPYIDGHAPAQGLNHPAMIAMARIADEDITESNEWQMFDIPFEYNKEIDKEKLANGNYAISVVFSSSNGGDEFKGAPGSTLYIDEVEIIYE